MSTAEEAAEFLREDDPRTPAEQAAIDALKKQMWVLWHAQDPNLGVVLLLSRAGLLRDKKQEAEHDKFVAWAKDDMTRARRLEGQHNTALENLIDEAVKQIEDGDAPGGVAAWMRERRTAIEEAVDKAKRAHLH